MRRIWLASAPAALLAISTATAQTVDLATDNPGTFYYTQAAAIAPVLRERTGIDIRIQTFTSPNIYLPVVNAGEIDLGIANLHELRIALAGREPYGGKKNEALRLVAVTSPLLAALFVKRDSPIKSFADLRGKRVGWEFSGQPMFAGMMKAYLDAGGLSESDVVRIPLVSADQGADEFAAGRTDAFLYSPGAAKVAEVAARVGGIRAVSLPNSSDARAALEKSLPAAHIAELKPAPSLAGIDVPATLVAVDAAIFTHAAADEERIGKVTAAMYENVQSLVRASPALRGLSTGKLAKKAGPLRYHPGALKAHRESGLNAPN